MDLHPRVVPASAEVVALLVVGGGAEPGRLHRAVVERLEDDEALLEVGLVIVGALERRPPVVHRVEEHVVQDDPAALANDPAVVDDPRVARRIVVVALRRGGGRAARDAAPQQQRGDEAGIDEPRRRGRPARGDPGAENRWCSGRPCQRRSSSADSGSGTNRRNCASPGGGSPTAASRSRFSSPAGIATRASRRFGPVSRSQASTYDPAAIGKNSSPSVNRRMGSWRRSRSRSVGLAHDVGDHAAAAPRGRHAG